MEYQGDNHLVEGILREIGFEAGCLIDGMAQTISKSIGRKEVQGIKLMAPKDFQGHNNCSVYRYDHETPGEIFPSLDNLVRTLAIIAAVQEQITLYKC